MTEAPKRIWAWPDKGNPESVTGRWSCNTYSSDLTQSYILATEHERMMVERDAEIARMRDARILVLPGGLTGVCVGSRFGGWLMRRHPDGQWVSVVKLQEVDPNPEARSSAGDVARAALGDDNG